MRTSLIVIALAVAGCGSNGGNGDMGTDMAVVVPIPTNFDSINTEILQPSCGLSTVCHKGKSMLSNNLDLSSDPYGQLVGQPSFNALAFSQGLLRVKPCDSKNSFVVIKLLLDPKLDGAPDLAVNYGNHMPYTSPSMDPKQIQAIKDWIDRGALRNEPATVSGNTCQVAATDMSGHD